jgi:ribonuclease Z
LPTLLLPVPSSSSTNGPSSRPLSVAEQSSYSRVTPSFELTFLGTCSGRPTPARNVSSIALRTGAKDKKLMLFDCGDGTQLRLLKARHLSLDQLAMVFVTHMHGDHVFGLSNLIAAACNRSLEAPLHIFGPQGIAQFVKTNMSATHTWLERPLVFHELLKNNVRAVRR